MLPAHVCGLPPRQPLKVGIVHLDKQVHLVCLVAKLTGAHHQLPLWEQEQS